jgi:serine/threonine-protein kinase
MLVDPRDATGTFIGRYEILCAIASGGMATVYLGRVRGIAGFERLVAIKRCHPHLRQDAEFAAMFLDEARLAARIRHPNVVPTLDVVDDGESLCLVMEYVEGAQLSALLKAARAREEPLPAAIGVRVVLDALEGLHAAHELKGSDGACLDLVHRDVSPQNMLVGVDGVTRLADFGIAKATGGSVTTRSGEVKGKVAYMAPEQLLALGVTRRSDVYAAGVVLWELLVGQRLFRADSDAALINQVLRARPEAPSTKGALTTAALDAAVLRAMAASPEDRFETAQAFAEAIEAAGVAPATVRNVASCVRELVGEGLSARRSLLDACEPRIRDSQPGQKRSAPEASATETKLDKQEPTVATVSFTPASSKTGRRARRRRTLLFVGGALLAATVLIGVLSMRRAPLADSDSATLAESASVAAPTPPVRAVASATSSAVAPVLSAASTVSAASSIARPPAAPPNRKVARPRSPAPRPSARSSAPDFASFL